MATPKTIDLNCDLGESFGQYTIGRDEEMLPLISSVNIACGFHAGDANVMRHTVQQAQSHSLAIGAHPGFQDLQGFGRRDMKLAIEDIYSLVVYQIGALQAFCQVEGAQLSHVKPHGALYNMAAKDMGIADAIARAVHDVDPAILLFGRSRSALIDAGQRQRLHTVEEAFIDRTYQKDGSLTPRQHTNAVHLTVEGAVAQALDLIQNQTVTTVDGAIIHVPCQTLCLHGDHQQSVELAKALREAMAQQGLSVASTKRRIG
ncbi:LamB/YcsF family protein [Aureibacillus halotolerans]|uniref:5-oxoprolinase subunit A n=1 Tax=Aureibacillus halotolerans TaxID=1508390 RepID=A0A4V3D582_9BACI|nr:5-oxoprolinase subunit PxpA [Aureibacillus halotolerans]TDQ38787.1 UPF0271 protein [Aureibacillus halotolerans]